MGLSLAKRSEKTPVSVTTSSINSNGEEERGGSSETSPEKAQWLLLSEPEKILSISILSAMSFLGPASGNIFYPALGVISKDLHISKGQISLSVTCFMIMQALFPLLTARFSDYKGRRPVIIICLTVYIAANIGLALQSHFAALLVLRSIQSIGSSSVSILAIATLRDIIDQNERGKYRMYTSLGFSLALMIGPLLGGLLSHFLGWRSIFYFLATFAAIILLLVVMFLRESRRVLVGNGSIPPSRWNKAMIDFICPRPEVAPEYESLAPAGRRPGFIDTMKIPLKQPTGKIIIVQAIIFCGTISIFISIPHLFSKKYNFNTLQIGLAYLPFAVGGFAARWIVSPLMAWNLRRHRSLVGVETKMAPDPPQKSKNIPAIKPRLQLILPLVYLSAALVAIYGWLMSRSVHISGPLIVLFFIGIAIMSLGISMTGLLIALHKNLPATTLAASNMVRFLIGAGASAAALPLIKMIHIGWVGTLIACLYLTASLLLWVVYIYGHR